MSIERDKRTIYDTYFSNSKSSRRSGKNRRGSSTARIAKEARKRKESPSNSRISHNRAHASNGR